MDEDLDDTDPDVLEALGVTRGEAERIIDSIRAHGPGGDPVLDTTEAAHELWWSSGHWDEWEWA